MMNYNENMTAFRRLVILALLRSAPAYTLHEVTLKESLAKRGQAVGTDALRADLQWLHEQGLIFAEHPDGVWFAQLTARGDDVERGLTQVPGVARPEPQAL
jgi:repressor of nif and glnA expression